MKTNTYLMIVLFLLITGMSLISCSDRYPNNPYLNDLYSKATKGDVESQKKLANAYLYGLGVKSDDSMTYYWFKKAADSGDAIAQYEVGQLLEKGRGAEKNIELSIKYITMAAKKNHSSAQYDLALKYAIGEGIAKDIIFALYWAKRAATGAHRDAIDYVEKLIPLCEKSDIEKVELMLKEVKE